MKKVAFLVLIFCLAMNSCSKKEYDSKEVQKKLLFDQISSIMNQKTINWNPEELLVSNCENPFDGAGLIAEKITHDILLKAKGKMSDRESLTSEFLNSISMSLSEIGLSTDDNDLNEEEFLVSKFLIDIYLQDGFDIYNFKSKEIENAINASFFFNENQKKRILINSSILRYTINAINIFSLENEMGKAGPWTDCFVAKLRELQDCGNCWIERIYCSLSWPTCLGVKALDCVIDLIF